jgi:hypothetical protein
MQVTNFRFLSLQKFRYLSVHAGVSMKRAAAVLFVYLPVTGRTSEMTRPLGFHTYL